MNKREKLMKLKKWKERKDKENQSVRLDEEEPETNKNEDSAFLREIQQVDKEIGDFMKKQASRRARQKIYLNLKEVFKNGRNRSN
ncbi:MAG: hypothetical protein GY839_19395 [candidate division Zixibacteria bacterium]|nr:hypothetical protein [candidate division Zixibacteria bacterium]